MATGDVRAVRAKGVQKGWETDTGHPIRGVVLCDTNGAPSSIDSPTFVQLLTPGSPFGDFVAVPLTAVAQVDAVYGASAETEFYTGGAGTLTSSGALFTCTAGATTFGYAVARTKRAARYRAGQGVEFRITALFDTPIASTSQQAGAFTAGSSLVFEYNGETFGIQHKYGSKLEIQRLTISAAASGAETATVTLNGTAYNVSLTAGTAAQTAAELAAGNYSGNYVAFQNGSTVTYIAQAEGEQAGAFSLSSTGTAAGTFAEVQNGSLGTTVRVAQSAWNVDPMDGTGPSGMTLDQQTINIYRIVFGYLGVAGVLFYVYNPADNCWQLVHRYAWANENTVPFLENPSLKVGLVAYNLGGGSVSVSGASAAAFIQGRVEATENPRGTSATNTSVGTSQVNVLTIRNRAEFANTVNLRELKPKLASVAASGGKPVTVNFYLNADSSTTRNWSYVNQSESIVEQDTSAGAPSNGTLLFSQQVAGGSTSTLNLSDLGLVITRTESLMITAAVASGSATDVAVSVTWEEN